jgi:hypothetical protein
MQPDFYFIERGKTMSEMKLAEHIADLALATSYKTLPAPAIAYVKTLLLDVLGSMVGTRKLESSQCAGNS